MNNTAGERMLTLERSFTYGDVVVNAWFSFSKTVRINNRGILVVE